MIYNVIILKAKQYEISNLNILAIGGHPAHLCCLIVGASCCLLQGSNMHCRTLCCLQLSLSALLLKGNKMHWGGYSHWMLFMCFSHWMLFMCFHTHLYYYHFFFRKKLILWKLACSTLFIYPHIL